MKTLRILSLVMLVWFALTPEGFGQGSSFRFSGHLVDSGSPAEGLYDMDFKLYAVEVGGAPITFTISRFNVPVTNGLFNVVLDFAATPFDGSPRWLETLVRASGSGSGYTTLSPRMQIMSSPYAIRAAVASTVYGNAGLRIQPTGVSPNIIAGSPANFIPLTVVGATISGGGNASAGTYDSNVVTASYGTIGGGRGNRVHSEESTIGGGYWNIISNATHATVAGGDQNSILGGLRGAIGGGFGNFILEGANSTIAGGVANGIRSGAGNSTIGGGGQNRIGVNAEGATVPGGYNNLAAGDYSLAAGKGAAADHDGSFVWADSTGNLGDEFASTRDNQFAIRAHGGLTVVSTNIALELASSGSIKMTGAGVGTSTPVFTHRVTAASIPPASSHVTIIDHPHANDDPNALLIVTHNWSKDTAADRYETNAVGVYYSAGTWRIFHENTSIPMPVGRAFNVMIIKP